MVHVTQKNEDFISPIVNVYFPPRRKHWVGTAELDLSAPFTVNKQIHHYLGEFQKQDPIFYNEMLKSLANAHWV